MDLTYIIVVDSYFAAAPECLLLVIGLKNVFAFGFSYGIVPWVKAWHYDGAFGALAAIQFGLMFLGLPLWYYGKEIRHATCKWKVILW